MKAELDRKTVKGFAELRAKASSCLTDNNDEDEKAKGTKQCVIIINLNSKIIKTVQKQLELKVI